MEAKDLGFEIDETYFLMVAKNLPSSPPLKPGGDVTVREMHPYLTEEQLDFVMAHHRGSMKKD
jgi:hypothetical protein